MPGVWLTLASAPRSYGIILAPSRELARQTFEIMKSTIEKMRNHDPKLPEIRILLVMGGK